MPDEFTTITDQLGTTPTRQPGEFRRKGAQGGPIVTSLTNTRKPTGNAAELKAKAEAAGFDLAAEAKARDVKVSGKLAAELLGSEPADETYARPSSLGDEIGNPYSLIKWKERQVALGIAMDPAVLERLNDVNQDDPKSERDVLDGIVARAHEVAESSLAADRGSYVHTLTEWADDGMNGEPPYCDPRFKLTPADVQAIAFSWRDLLFHNQLEILASETPTICDEFKAAGTADRFARTGRNLSFGTGDALIPAGTVVVLDIKTSKLHADSNGLPSYWAGYPIQVYVYADSLSYDPDNDTRTPWPWPVSTEHALIAHLDIDALLNGEGAVWQLIYTDLAVGRQGALAVQAAKDYARTQAFVMPATKTVVPVGGDTPQPTTADRMAALEARFLGMVDADRARFVALNVDMTDPDAVEAALNSVDPFMAETEQVTRITPVTEPVAPAPTLTAATVEGPNVDPGVAKAIHVRYSGLNGPQQAWVNTVATDAQNAGGPLGMADTPTQRRAELVNAIVTYAREFVVPGATVENEADAEDMFRACLETVTGPELAWSAAFTLGQLVATINADQAVTLGHIINLLTQGLAPLSFTDDGRPHISLQPAA